MQNSIDLFPGAGPRPHDGLRKGSRYAPVAPMTGPDVVLMDQEMPRMMHMAAAGGLPASRERVIPRLAAVAVLCGSNRTDRPITRLSRSVPDLPAGADRTLAGDLLHRLLGSPDSRGPAAMPPCTFLTDPRDNRPVVTRDPLGRPVRALQDRTRHRGTAGSLADFAAEFDPDDLLLAVVGSERLAFDASSLASDLAALGADLALPRLACGTPVGVWLIRAGALREVPAVGFVDLKEQALPAIARRHDVRVLTIEGTESRGCHTSVRSREDFLHAVRLPVTAADSAEPWRSVFSIVEVGAEVHPEAIIHDSVVLAGARVERGAVVARSVVDAGCHVRAGERVVDRVVVGRREGRS